VGGACAEELPPGRVDGEHDGAHLSVGEEGALPVEVGAARDDGDRRDGGLASGDPGGAVFLVELSRSVPLGSHRPGTDEHHVGVGAQQREDDVVGGAAEGPGRAVA